MEKNKNKTKQLRYALFFNIPGRIVHVLFSRPSQSFPKDYEQCSNGVWPVSYATYVKFQNRVRFFSVSFFVFLVAGVMTTSIIAERFFPSDEVGTAMAGEIFYPTSTIIVKNLNTAGTGSLRSAIATASNGSTINFGDLEGTITLQTGLGQLTKNITIAGNGKVTIDGTNVVGANGNSAHGLYCAARVTVSDLAIKNFSGNGIYATEDCDNAIFQNLTLSQNDASGININGASGIRVDNNIIFDNGTYGIYTTGDSGVLIGNTIGTDADGTTTVGNNDHGIYIVGSTATDNIIDQNSVWFNGASGIFVFTEADRTTISSNIISHNAKKGIHLRNSNDHTIANNTIQANGGDGIMVASSTGVVLTGNTISGNGGSDADDDTHNGLQFESSTAIVGDAGDGNTIVGNNNDGVLATSSTLTLVDNFIGTDADNSAGKGNGKHGVEIVGESVLTATGNVVGNNSGSGFYLDGETTANSGHVLTNNRIGIGSNATSLGNQKHGVAVSGNVTNVTLGTLTAGNIIADNIGSGIFVDAKGAATSGIAIIGNSIFENQGQLSETSSAPRGIVLLNGANDEISSPTIANCITVFVAGTANSVANSTIHVYIASNGNQGKTFLGSVTTDDAGAWSSSFDTWSWASGHSDFSGVDSIVATVTDSENSTSSFSSSCALSQAVDDNEDSTDDAEPSQPDEDNSATTPTTPDADDEEPVESDDGLSVFDYLKAENIEVNGIPVLQTSSEPLSIDSTKSITVIGRGANFQHRIVARLLLEISKKENIAKAVQNDIAPAKNGTWRFITNQKPKSGKVYIVDALGTVGKKSSKRKTLVRLIGADSPPTFNGDDVILITEPIVTKTLLSGIINDDSEGRFRILNDDGVILSDCSIDDNAEEDNNGDRGCHLDTKLSVGEYTLQFQILNSSATPSTPTTIPFVVSDNVPREHFYVEPSDERFFQRVTTTSHVNLYGIAPVGAIVRLSLDDVVIGDAERDSVSWNFDLDLTNQVRTQHVLLVEYLRDEKPVQPPLTFPLLYAPVLVEPTIVTPQTMTIGVPTVIQFCGGKDNTATIAIDAENITETFDEQVEDVHACTNVTVTPTEIGALTLGVTAEDANGLQGTTSQTVTVLAKQAATIPSPANPIDTPENNEEPDDAINPLEPSLSVDDNTDSSTNTLPSSDNAEDQSGDPFAVFNQPDESVSVPSADVVPTKNISFPAYDADIPEQYLQEETASTERSVIKRALRKDIIQSLNVVAETVEYDRQGNIVRSNRIVPNEGGAVLLHTVRTVGMANIWNRDSLNRKEDMLTFSGVTAPGAGIAIIIRSEPIVKVARADSEGRWTITIPANILPEGEHSAFLQTTSRGVTTDEVEISRFIVVQEDQISGTTWLLMSNVLIGAIALLIGLTLHMRKKKSASIKR